MALASLKASPGSVPRSVTRYDPEPVGLQTTAWLVASALSEFPAIRPSALMARAQLTLPPGSAPRSVTRYDPEPVGVQTTA